mmetsp:Transcript_71257/g.133291  ORF Transcript_71257/g.133291 Transcript_71257/m.133291 type:complete len:455 (-) Transcript_71257:82-1446(-)
MAASPPSAGKDGKKSKEREKVDLPAAEPIFKIIAPEKPTSSSVERCGELLGEVATPTFVVLTSRCVPQYWQPHDLAAANTSKQLFELPIGDLLLRTDAVSAAPDGTGGCSGFWPHLKNQFTYCSFRNPLRSISVYGGDAVCSVETFAGRRKVSPKELLSVQKIMRATLLAAPGEEVGLDVSTSRRTNRAITRAEEWLKEILETKVQDTDLASFPWHVIASIQGGADVKLRQKAAATVAALPVAGCWIGGLGYGESLSCRSGILEAVTSTLPVGLPRFLPLNDGSPVEVLHAVLYGIDVLEVPYPTALAVHGTVLTFDWEMPASELTAAKAEESCSQNELEEALQAAAVEVVAKQLHLRSPQCREEFGPISASSSVRQYPQAYLCHLFEVHELLGTILAANHNVHVYECFLEAIRSHIRQGTFRRYASWFIRTQTEKPSGEPSPVAPAAKRRKHA